MPALAEKLLAFLQVDRKCRLGLIENLRFQVERTANSYVPHELTDFQLTAERLAVFDKQCGSIMERYYKSAAGSRTWILRAARLRLTSWIPTPKELLLRDVAIGVRHGWSSPRRIGFGEQIGRFLAKESVEKLPPMIGNAGWLWMMLSGVRSGRNISWSTAEELRNRSGIRCDDFTQM
jgi:hypothetical protein